MKIVMTGGNGFIGSHIARQLVRDGHKVTILHRSTSDLVRLKDIEEQLDYVNLSKVNLEQLFEERHFNIVIHCATVYSRSNDIAQIGNVIESNIEFPAQLLYLAKKNACIGFINTCTFFLKYFRGNLGLNTHMSLYMLSKRQFREWGECLASDGGISFITMQLEHVYGLDDGKGKLIPSLLKAMDTGEDNYDLSTGTQTRDFITVEDVARAYSVVIKSLDNKKLFGIYTFEVGTEKERTLRNFIELIKEGKKSSIKLNWGKYIPNDKELNSSVADSEELHELGWKAEIIDDKQIVQYFREKSKQRIYN